MKQTKSRPEPPVLKRGGFQLCEGRITVSDFERVRASHLEDLFHPEEVERKEDWKAVAEEAERLSTKPFFAAQLKHYGIKYSPASATPKLRKLLEDSLDQGKCDDVPDSVARLHDALRRDYKPLYQNWKDAIRAWDTVQLVKTKPASVKTAFAKCTTPTQRAECDLDLFLDHYFFTDGRPDPRKTPTPLTVHGFKDRSSLHSLVADRVPGLNTLDAGSKTERAVCIGWDYDDVCKMSSQVTKQAKKLHPEGGFSIERCRGSYVVECKAACGFDVDPRQKLTLDIWVGKDGLLLAALDFGVFEGTMILSCSEEKLDAIAFLDTMFDNDEKDSADESDEEEEEEDEDFSYDRFKSGKERGTSARTAVPKKRAAKGDSAERPPPKKKKRRMAPSLARRVYFRLRGQDTAPTYTMPCDTPEPGHLDFLDDGCTRFAGLAYDFPYIGKNVEFRGRKVSDAARRKPEPWGSWCRSRGYARGAEAWLQ